MIDTGTVFGKSTYLAPVDGPQLVLSGLRNKHKWEVYAGPKANVISSLWEYDLIINCTGKRLDNPPRNHYFPDFMGMKAQQFHPGYRELIIDWPDFATPDMPLAFWQQLLRVVQRKRRTLVFCMGGQGRTGTCLGILAMLSQRITGEEAIKLVRATYKVHAVETKEQERQIKRLGELAGIKAKKGAGDGKG